MWIVYSGKASRFPHAIVNKKRRVSIICLTKKLFHRKRTYICARACGIHLTPTKLGFFTFTQAKHAQHIRYPLRDVLNEAHILGVTRLRVDVNICSRDELAQNFNSFRCVEGVAECLPELGLSPVQPIIVLTFCQTLRPNQRQANVTHSCSNSCSCDSK